MESNPKVMLELMPPTPGRSEKRTKTEVDFPAIQELLNPGYQDHELNEDATSDHNQNIRFTNKSL